MKNTRLLVIVDESPATKRALEYVAQVASRRRDFRICLAHALPSPPPELVEFRGAEKGRLRAYKRRWISVVEMTEQRALDRANAVLRRGGIAEKAIEAHYCNLVDASRATDEILGLVRLRKCETVVIGRDSLSWLGELIHGDPQRNLSAKAKDLRSGSSNEVLESSRSVFERDYERIDKPRFKNVIKDAS